MFASNFGNLGAYVIGAPVLLVALLLGIIGACLRIRAVQIVAGITCLLVAAFFYWSLKWAGSDDRDFTILAIEISVALGLVMVAVSFLLRKKS